MAKITKAKKKKRIEPVGRVYVTTSFNNIIVSVTDLNGNVHSWSSAGKMKFRGSKKNTPYAAQLAAQDCVKSAHDLGLREAEVFVKGTGSGREAAIRTVGQLGVKVTKITDTTPLPHNGCRPPKKRRV